MDRAQDWQLLQRKHKIRQSLPPKRPLQTGASLAKRTGQVPAWVCQVSSWNLPFPSPRVAFPSPLLSLHWPLSKHQGAGGCSLGCWGDPGRIPGGWWDPGMLGGSQGAGEILGDPGQVSREGAAASGVGGLGSALCSWPQLAGSHRKKLSPPSFIFLPSCVLDASLKGPLKQHKLPQTLLLS